MTTSKTTTIRVSIKTRDRITDLLKSERFAGMTVDGLIQHWLREQWEADSIAAADRLREQHLGHWGELLPPAEEPT